MAYSRRGAEVGLAGGDGEQDAAGMLGGHPGGEVGSGFMTRLLLMTAPFEEEAVGQAREHPMHPHGVGMAQAALVVASRYVEPGVQAGLDAPVCPVELQPARGVELLRGQAREQGHGFRRAAAHFAAQARGLRGQGEGGGFGGDGGALEGAGFGAAFVAFVGAGQGRGTFRGEKPPAGWRRGVRYWPAPWAGCP